MILPLLGKSAVVVVMLTPGCLQSADQVGIICASFSCLVLLEMKLCARKVACATLTPKPKNL